MQLYNIILLRHNKNTLIYEAYIYIKINRKFNVRTFNVTVSISLLFNYEIIFVIDPNLVVFNSISSVLM